MLGAAYTVPIITPIKRRNTSQSKNLVRKTKHLRMTLEHTHTTQPKPSRLDQGLTLHLISLFEGDKKCSKVGYIHHLVTMQTCRNHLRLLRFQSQPSSIRSLQWRSVTPLGPVSPHFQSLQMRADSSFGVCSAVTQLGPFTERPLLFGSGRTTPVPGSEPLSASLGAGTEPKPRRPQTLSPEDGPKNAVGWCLLYWFLPVTLVSVLPGPIL